MQSTVSPSPLWASASIPPVKPPFTPVSPPQIFVDGYSVTVPTAFNIPAFGNQN